MTDFHEAQQLYQERGFGHQIGFGQHPALLVVDVIQAFTNPASPLGSDLDTVVHAVQRLLEVARSKNVPIVFTTVGYDESAWQSAHIFITKVPALKVLRIGTPEVDIDPRLERRAAESILLKQFASAFFGTPLSSLLAAQHCDTVIVTGCTTSGCVRASVVDALQYGYRPIVPLEAVGDRSLAAHNANLFDMDAKYGDVVALNRVLDYLHDLPARTS
ncbi:MAG: N-carbamoylsarcosine amidohydrolase [Ktedonobacteraceae bacterium]